VRQYLSSSMLAQSGFFAAFRWVMLHFCAFVDALHLPCAACLQPAQPSPAAYHTF
jgi:hypothetical protein